MNTWWIDEPDILASSCPTADALKALYHQNFRIVVSLLHEREQPPIYDPVAISNIGYKRYNIPIPESGFPTKQQVKIFLNLTKNRQYGERILVHCMHGQKRTKTMAAAYLLSKGLAAEDIVNRLYAKK